MKVLWFALVCLWDNHVSPVEYAGCSLGKGLGLPSCSCLVFEYFEYFEYFAIKEMPQYILFLEFCKSHYFVSLRFFIYGHFFRKYGNYDIHL